MMAETRRDTMDALASLDAGTPTKRTFGTALTNKVRRRRAPCVYVCLLTGAVCIGADPALLKEGLAAQPPVRRLLTTLPLLSLCGLARLSLCACVCVCLSLSLSLVRGADKPARAQPAAKGQEGDLLLRPERGQVGLPE